MLCGLCLARVEPDRSLLPEHVVWREPGDERAYLFDGWGRAYRLRNPTVIGRGEPCDLAILSPAISREHARVRRSADGWTLADIGSRNGTFRNDEPVVRSVFLASGDVVRVAMMGFLFSLLEGHLVDDDRRLEIDTASALQEDRSWPAEVELFALYRRPGDGVGLLETDGRLIELTEIQYDLVSLLRKRLKRDASEPEPVRGFVSSDELLACLAWETAYPNDAHLVQLVRRLRGRLAGTPLQVEARRGLGYRLRVALLGRT